MDLRGNRIEVPGYYRKRRTDVPRRHPSRICSSPPSHQLSRSQPRSPPCHPRGPRHPGHNRVYREQPERRLYRITGLPPRRSSARPRPVVSQIGALNYGKHVRFAATEIVLVREAVQQGVVPLVGQLQGKRAAGSIPRFPYGSRNPNSRYAVSPYMETTYRDLRRRYWANVGGLLLVAAIFLVLAFRGGMVLLEGIIAGNEPMPVELRGVPSPDELPRIPPARSWNV
jgi:hypothetical protein